ncbi:hypothetical protein BJ973_008943 [Actinoplanes tereljensis]|uniref:Cellulase (Glycosyl hydrolase family 5) n=1 Tax=Paractinoplanes tereljensis TaxID=571912 RepID=A0A919NHK9_9ACTN|nr:glycosyl hydrolase [Actinoplanes tereljensis]GIF18092.1 hypothetical protein Ate02nite_08220 [Actinoplanes tereljensis]
MNLSRRHRAAVIASTVLLGFAAPAAAPAIAKPTAVKPATTTVSAKAVTEVPTLASRMAAVKAAKTINYYPAKAGWAKMWTDFDAAQIDADMAKADALGATSARAIIFPSTFGYPTLNSTYTSRLATFVKIADKYGMTVKFTLFDWWGQYSEVANSFNWANNLLRAYKDDPRIISVELQNEFDPDDVGGIIWAKKIVPLVRAAYPTMPLTFSVNGDDGAVGMGKIKAALVANPLDYYDFHFYTSSERALAVIKQAQATVAPTPMVIGEVGLNTLQNTEGEQAAFLARVFQAAKAAGVQSVAPWTLTDFATGAIPESQVSKIPAQYTYGLYRTNGVAKAAAAVVKAAWTGIAQPGTLMDTSFENGTGLSPWRAYLPELGQAVKTQTQARTGKWSVTLTNTGKTASGAPSFRVAPLAPVVSGQKWHGEAWARGNAATGATQIALSWFDINDKWLGGGASALLPTGTTNWTKLVVDGVAPAGSVSMQIHLKSAENTGTVWFDDVVVSAS